MKNIKRVGCFPSILELRLPDHQRDSLPRLPAPRRSPGMPQYWCLSSKGGHPTTGYTRALATRANTDG